MTTTTKKTAPANPLAKSEEGKGVAMKSPYEIVVMGEAARRFKKNMWEQLVNQALLAKGTGLVRRASFESNMLQGEKEYMEKYHGKDPQAKNAAGDWKFRSYLPGSYRTAKSVAANCLDQGVFMRDTAGKVVGKSACEEAYKAGRIDKPVAAKTPMEKAMLAIELLDKVIPTLDDREFVVIAHKLAARCNAKRSAQAA